MKHFTPKYNLWDQRVCAAPNGDFYKAFRRNRVSIVTDHIVKFTKNSILLRSPESKELHPDIIVMATGLNLLFAGGIEFFIDGTNINMQNEYVYKGFMLSNVPNMFF